MPQYSYIMVDRKPVPVDYETWSKWFFETGEERRVKRNVFETCDVSTVFVGLDHNFDDDDPHVFETLVIGGPHDGLEEKCATWDQAIAQHESVCDKVK